MRISRKPHTHETPAPPGWNRRVRSSIVHILALSLPAPHSPLLLYVVVVAPACVPNHADRPFRLGIATTAPSTRPPNVNDPTNRTSIRWPRASRKVLGPVQRSRKRRLGEADGVLGNDSYYPAGVNSAAARAFRLAYRPTIVREFTTGPVVAVTPRCSSSAEKFREAIHVDPENP